MRTGRKIAATAALTALMGAVGAAVTLEIIADFEGYSPEAYRDPVGIWTKCYGDTANVIPGRVYSAAECVQSLNDAVERHAGPVFACVPGLVDAPAGVKAAAVSMAYNIGVGNFCTSSVAGHFNAGNFRRGCTRIAEIYTTAGGKPLAGLKKRRAAEARLCLDALEAAGR